MSDFEEYVVCVTMFFVHVVNHPTKRSEIELNVTKGHGRELLGSCNQGRLHML